MSANYVQQTDEEYEQEFLFFHDSSLTGFVDLLSMLSDAQKMELSALLGRYRRMLGFDAPADEQALSQKQLDLKAYASYLPEQPVLDLYRCAEFMSHLSGIHPETCCAYVSLY